MLPDIQPTRRSRIAVPEGSYGHRLPVLGDHRERSSRAIAAEERKLRGTGRPGSEDKLEDARRVPDLPARGRMISADAQGRGRDRDAELLLDTHVRKICILQDGSLMKGFRKPDVNPPRRLDSAGSAWRMRGSRYVPVSTRARIRRRLSTYVELMAPTVMHEPG